MKDVDETVESFDPKIETRLRTINGVGLHIERSVEPAQRDLLVRKGVISGLTSAAALVHKVMEKVQAEIDDETLDGDQAKLVLRWLDTARASIVESVQLNQRDHAKQEGLIEGMKRSVSLCETLFKQESAKAERRVNEQERDDTDEGGRPLPIREIMENRSD